MKCLDCEGWTLLTHYYDLSPCVAQTALFVAPSLVALSSLHQLYRLQQVDPAFRYSSKWDLFVKQILCYVQIGILLVLPLFIPHDTRQWTPLVLALATAFISRLQRKEYGVSIASASVLLFWSVQLCFCIAVMYGWWIRDHTDKRYLTGVVLLTLISLSELILSAIIYTPPESSGSPFDSAHLLSRISYSWLDDILRRGAQEPLKLDDIPPPPKELKSDELVETWAQTRKKLQRGALSSILGHSKASLSSARPSTDEPTEASRLIGSRDASTYSTVNGESPSTRDSTSGASAESSIKQAERSILTKLILTFYSDYLLCCIFNLITTFTPFIQPFLLRALIMFVRDFNEGAVPLSRGISIVLASVAAFFGSSLLSNKSSLLSNALQMKITITLTSAIHEKALSMSLDGVSPGDIVQIMSSDLDRIASTIESFDKLWRIPLEIVLCWSSMFFLIGNSMWVGLLVMFLTFPVSATLSRLKFQLTKQMRKVKTKRYDATNAILTNIKSIKLYNWEGIFKGKVLEIRNNEEFVLKRRQVTLKNFDRFLWRTTTCISSSAAFAYFVLVDKRQLTTEVAFPALTLFGILKGPFSSIPNFVNALLEAKISMDRVEQLFESVEVAKRREPDNKTSYDGSLERDNGLQVSSPSVSLSNCTYYWDHGLEHVALQNVTLNATSGQLVSIVGRVGAGKTAFLLSLLGDTFQTEGESQILGSTAYVAQSPWILNATVRDNILFGSKFDQAFYDATLEACALLEDLELLPDGDLTEVGEKGISLSGGQKSRVGIARAVYSRADVILLDDPLAAVDEHVKEKLLERVLGPRGLLRSKVRILATNTVGAIEYSDAVYLLEGGQVVEAGDAQERLDRLVAEYGGSRSSPVQYESNKGDPSDSSESGVTSKCSSDVSIDENLSLRRVSTVSHFSATVALREDVRKTRVLDEVTTVGSVKSSIYWTYFSACGWGCLGLFVFFTLLSSGSGVASSLWLKFWGDSDRLSPLQFILGYFFLGIASGVLSVTAATIWYSWGAIRASEKLHVAMLDAVIRSPMVFFESTPIGRITNRFSTDIQMIDNSMPNQIESLLTGASGAIESIVVIAVGSPLSLVIIVPTLLLYRSYQKYYIATSREVRRLASAAGSPVLSHFHETLQGLSTVRAFGKQRYFTLKNSSRLDIRTKTAFMRQTLSQWLSVRLSLIGACILLGAGVSVLATLATGGSVSPGTVGLIMTYALGVSSNLRRLVNLAIRMEVQSVAVERIVEYTELEPEGIKEDDGSLAVTVPPPTDWPDKGAVQFKDYSTRYRAGLEPVLRKVSIKISPREKVGVVGRTGAGKSSLAMSLFRIIEATSGGIFIDGVDISTLDLGSLRSHLSIIPQDAQIFEGTIRSNLDPGGVYDDAELWRVLKLSSLGFSLDMELSRDGGNLSSGQRQLMCLGRALLNPSPILVLDEATAAVDVETDHTLQETIRTQFQHKTIVTIAHRLNTIMDSDKILVLDKGRVVEFGAPSELLKDSASLFYKLCEKGGTL